MHGKRDRIAVMELTDITNTEHKQGLLSLERIDFSYFIRWTPHVNDDKEEGWNSTGQFLEECLKLHLFIISPSYEVLLQRFNDSAVKHFSFSALSSAAKFVEQLIIRGVAVVSDKNNYTLEFCRAEYPKAFYMLPATLRMHSCGETIVEFWTAVLDFSSDVIQELQSRDLFDKDGDFPLGTVAKVLTKRVVDRMLSDPLEQQNGKKKLLDENGEIIDKENFRHWVALNGILPEERKQLIPYVLGVYDIGWNKDELQRHDEQLKQEFNVFHEQMKSITSDQLRLCSRISRQFTVIRLDVCRTDRSTKAFCNDDGIGVTLMSEILKTYVVFNPVVGYLQGMCDLLVPIILIYLPDWNDNGEPVDQEGKVICDWKADMYHIFWCLDGLIENISHDKLLQDVTVQCSTVAKAIMNLTSVLSPTTELWLRTMQNDSLLWLYPDFVMLFKRTLPDVWDVWCVINCISRPSQGLLCLVTACVLLLFEWMVELPKCDLPHLMREVGPRIKTLDLAKITRATYHVHQELVRLGNCFS